MGMLKFGEFALLIDRDFRGPEVGIPEAFLPGRAGDLSGNEGDDVLDGIWDFAADAGTFVVLVVVVVVVVVVAGTIKGDSLEADDDDDGVDKLVGNRTVETGVASVSLFSASGTEAAPPFNSCSSRMIELSDEIESEADSDGRFGDLWDGSVGGREFGLIEIP